MRLGETLGITRQELIRSDGLPCLLVEWQLKEFEKDTVIPAGYRARHLGGRMWLTRPKTRKGQRLIPLPADLESYMDSAGIPDDQPVFRSGRGNPICKDTLHHAWRRALDRAGLPHVSIHSARHTAATAFARLGVSGLARQSILGHADVGTTNAIYTHVDAGMLAGAIDGVERLIEG